MQNENDLKAIKERAGLMRLLDGYRSPIAKDAELAAFIVEGLASMGVRDIHQACASRFGADRAPSRSAIHRFWQRLRKDIGSGSK